MKHSKVQITRGLALACAVITLSLAMRAQAQTVTYLAVVDGVSGVQPSSAIQATDGNFYATTNWGGPASEGNVVKITPAGGLSTLYDFAPDRIASMAGNRIRLLSSESMAIFTE